MDDEFDVWFQDERGTGQLELESEDECAHDSFDDEPEDM